jgi:hypothetical protein
MMTNQYLLQQNLGITWEYRYRIFIWFRESESFSMGRGKTLCFTEHCSSLVSVLVWTWRTWLSLSWKWNDEIIAWCWHLQFWAIRHWGFLYSDLLNTSIPTLHNTVSLQ